MTAGTGLEAVFPLWEADTHDHCAALLEAGLSAWVCSVDTGALPADRAGCRFDAGFVAGLPDGVDPCGEHDEYHTFVEWAPGWANSVPVRPVRSIEVYDSAFVELEPVSERDVPLADVVGDRGPEAVAAHGAAGPRADPFCYYARLARVRRHVDDHLAEDLNADAAARVAAMSRSGFSRYFREHVGMTFVAWLALHRVQHACRLLRERNIAVTRVGEAVGFHSERTFRRAFHEHTGCSPSQYRKRSLEENRNGAGGPDS